MAGWGFAEPLLFAATRSQAHRAWNALGHTAAWKSSADTSTGTLGAVAADFDHIGTCRRFANANAPKDDARHPAPRDPGATERSIIGGVSRR